MEQRTLKYLVQETKERKRTVKGRFLRGELTIPQLDFCEAVYANILAIVEPTLGEPISLLASTDVGRQLFERFPTIDRSTALGEIVFPVPSGTPRLAALLNAAHAASLIEAAYELRCRHPQSEEAATKGQRLRNLLCEDLFRFLRCKDLTETLRRRSKILLRHADRGLSR